MKYGIWRHENALGNSAEHTYGLYKHLLRTGDNNPIIYVENDFQKYFALCIPNIKQHNIRFFDDGIFEAMMSRSVINDPRFKDIYMPSAYGGNDSLKTYPAIWSDLALAPDCELRFPKERYVNKHSLPENAIIIQVREPNTFDKRISGINEDPIRSVDKNTFFDVALYFADKGHTVVRIGDKNQTPFPNHKNIIDFALFEDRNMLDDLYLISRCKVFLSCDSGIWPMAGGMKKNLVLSNITSILYPIEKPVIIDWLSRETTRVLKKTGNSLSEMKDNSFQELVDAVESFITKEEL